jgi:carbon monoxide dehydrogenase subunit G
VQLTNEVTLPAPPQQVFALLTDIDRAGPCWPGATLSDTPGHDSHQGTVRVQVGPVSARYIGSVRVLEVDEPARTLVLTARGHDEHGSGPAEAKVSVQIHPHENGSVLAVTTDLLVRGEIARFGLGALGELSQTLTEQFAATLTTLLESPAFPAEVSHEQATTGTSEQQPRRMRLAEPWGRRSATVLLAGGAVGLGVVLSRRIHRR